jgi:4-hydroxybutyrate CoA-transferase
MRPVPDWNSRSLPAEEAVRGISSGMNVFVHGASATPTPLVEALCRRTRPRGRDSLPPAHHRAGALPGPRARGALLLVSLFTGPAARRAIAEGRADFMPVFLSEIPGLFQSGRIPLDVALVQLSPPDRHGDCTLGTSRWTRRLRRGVARTPRGRRAQRADAAHAGALGASVPQGHARHRHGPAAARAPGLRAQRRGAPHRRDHRGLVEDGACLQMGIGAIPDAVLACLGRQARPGRAHRDVLRRARAADRRRVW